MAGDSEYKAVQNFRNPIQKAVSCVTKITLTTGWDYRVGYEQGLVLGDGDPVKLAGTSQLTLSLLQNYRIVEARGERGPFKVSTTAYFYALEDSKGHEIIAYHWHPNRKDLDGRIVTFPHLHLRYGAQVKHKQLLKAHLPTGRIAIEDLLRIAITEFKVQPLRDDWANILKGPQSIYEEWRTWSGSGGAN